MIMSRMIQSLRSRKGYKRASIAPDLKGVTSAATKDFLSSMSMDAIIA